MTGLRVRDLTVVYHTDDGPVAAVDDSSFDIAPGERLGIVGESGSGKTTTALALIQMLRPPGRVEAGSAVIDGVDLLKLGPADMRLHRLRTVSYVPQGAMSSLNPVMTIARQFRNALVDHDVRLGQRELELRIRQALAGVELDRRVAGLYPHELSGGMKQRVCIAIGMLLGPKLIIADEPTSALDVVTQRQVMETLGRQQRDAGSALILIGHDMGLMAQFVDRLAVMYAGRLVEIGGIRKVLEAPRHPYTRALVASVPRLARRGELHGIAGVTPSLRRLPPGCAFHPRCAVAIERCRRDRPVLDGTIGGHRAACHLAEAPLAERAA
ncbi:MAG TPA: ABC transporter ATP-binding protein [Geminicoccaceae bacterium]|nr:ABC transporter ATP-binding protein [Geminicoccus sp.]HMU48936.1 ABC transporter ATP-binding protein [Geminicoccaceae bacterium]